MFDTIKKNLSYYSGTFFTALLISQPVLDVFSYLMMQYELNVLTTVIRTIMLFCVAAYAFVISDDKRMHLILYAVIVGFWLLHTINCLRKGYEHPFLDLGEYLKLIQLPLWAFSFVAIFRVNEDLNVSISGILVINLCIILAVILLSYITRHPVYTYDYPDRNVQIGILGWFGVANAQSAIVTLLVPFVLLWAFQKHNLILFSIVSFVGFGLLYFTGTRLAYYAAILIAVFFAALIIWNREMMIFCAPLFLSVILLLAFRGFSPMVERQALTADSFAVYQEKTDAVMGDDKDFEYKSAADTPPEILEKIRKVYTDVYSGKGIYGNTLLGDLVDRFGVERVMEVYDYSIEPEDLYDVRTKRRKCVELLKEDSDFFTRLLGFEYTETYINGTIFDPENDFPALTGYYGYLGAAIYIVSLLYIILISVRAFLEEYPDFLTMEFGVASMVFVLALGAAQFSGQVLRKPSVTVYISLAAAIMYSLVNKPVHVKNTKYRKASVVHIKTLK